MTRAGVVILALFGTAVILADQHLRPGNNDETKEYRVRSCVDLQSDPDPNKHCKHDDPVREQSK